MMPAAAHNALTAEQELFLILLRVDTVQDERARDLLVGGLDWAVLRDLIERHAVLPLGYRRLNDLGADLVPIAERERLKKRNIDITFINLKLRKELERILKRFNACGITAMPLKGPWLAEQVYGDIAARQFTDLDLLVPPAMARAAVELLNADGYLNKVPLSTAADWQLFMAQHNEILLYHSGHGGVVEVHWALFHRKFFFGVDALGSAALLSREEEMLLFLCIHGSQHRWEQLKWLVDVGEFLHRRGDRIDWTRLLDLARQTGCLRMLLLGGALAREVRGLDLPSEFVEALARDPVVAELTRQTLADSLARNDPPWLGLHRLVYFLKFRDSLWDSLKMTVGILFFPTVAEWEAFPLPHSLRFLYWGLRPLHLVWRWKRE